MNVLSNRFLYVAILSSAILPATIGRAQDNGDRAIEQYACKDVMRDSGPDRDAAIAFLHGYLLGKSGNSTFNVELLRKQADLFIDRCLENPKEKAVDAMLKVKN